jgi:hypothetical protein
MRKLVSNQDDIMKITLIWPLLAALSPLTLLADATQQAQDICSIVDRYAQGSYHYFDCLEHIETIGPNLSLEQTIEFVCEAVDTFYGLGVTEKQRCFQDARIKLAPAPMACDSDYNLLDPAARVPARYKHEVVEMFQQLSKYWNNQYETKIEVANNGLIVDLQRSKKACLAKGYSQSLDGINPLKDALKECVFTSINAYSSPAITPENQAALSDAFAQENFGKFRFRKIINASLRFDPIAAFNTNCVLEVQSPKFPNYKLYMAGYTVD